MIVFKSGVLREKSALFFPPFSCTLRETGTWYLFHLIYAMQLVTPSAVAMADSTLMAV